MRITAKEIDKNMTQTEVDHLLNSLLVDRLEFSNVACLDGQAFGAETGCDQCGEKLGQHGRNLLIRQLISAHNQAETDVGYDITPRYHTEVIEWDGEDYVKLDRPGLSGIVRLEVEDPLSFGPFPVTPHIIENVPLVDSGEGYCIARLDSSIVKNPNEVTLRTGDNHLRLPQNLFGFPRRSGDGYWEVALQNDLLPPCEETLNAQHCNLLYVDTPSLNLEENEELFAVYPDSEQIIPFAKTPESLPGGGVRYWFYIYTLVDPAFSLEGANLGNGEFYKLLPSIDFRIFREVAAPITITYREQSPTSNDVPEFLEIPPSGYRIADPKHSVLEIFRDQDHPQAFYKSPVSIEVSYKTDPEVLGFSSDIPHLKSAVTYLAASEIPVTACQHCRLSDEGFISHAQRSYSQMRFSLSGEMIQNQEHGDLYGRKVYEEKISSVRRYHKMLMA